MFVAGLKTVSKGSYLHQKVEAATKHERRKINPKNHCLVKVLSTPTNKGKQQIGMDLKTTSQELRT